MARAKIKHIAIATNDPVGVAKFYTEVFGLETVGEINSRDVHGFYMTDGDINLALLHFKSGPIKEEIDRGEAPGHGLQHIGFLVEDTQATRETLLAHGATPRNKRPANSTGFFEEKFNAAGGIIIDVTGHPWPGVAPLEKEKATAAAD